MTTEELQAEHDVVREALLKILGEDTQEDLTGKPLAYLAGRCEELFARQLPIVTMVRGVARRLLDEERYSSESFDERPVPGVYAAVVKGAVR